MAYSTGYTRPAYLLGALFITLALLITACAPAAEEETPTTTSTTTATETTTSETQTSTVSTEEEQSTVTTDETPSGPQTVRGWWPNETPKGIRGGHFRTTLGTGVREATEFDPHTSTAYAHIAWSTFGDRAMVADPHTFEIKPSLVEKWEIDADGLGFTFHIREGITIGDNNVGIVAEAIAAGRRSDAEWTCEDFVFNLLRNTAQLAPQGTKARFHRRSGFAGMKPGGIVDGVVRGLAPEGVTAPQDLGPSCTDRYTARVEMDYPNTMFLSQFINVRNHMIPRGILLDDYGKDWKYNNIGQLVGTGAYINDTSTYVQGSRWDFGRNPDYWKATASGEPLPYLDRVTFYDIPDQATQMAAFLAGQLDEWSVRTIQDEEIVRDKYPTAPVSKYQSTCWRFLRFNPNNEPFTDARVTKAIHLALKLDDVMDIWYGDDSHGRSWYTHGPVPSDLGGGVLSTEEVVAHPEWGIYDPDPADHAKNVARAKELMTAAGHPEGEISWGIILTSSAQNNAQAQVIKHQLSTVWPKMEVNIEPSAATAFFGMQAAGNFQGDIYTICAQPDPLGDFRDNYHTTGSRNYGAFSNPAIDGLLDEALAATDPVARAALIREAEMIVIDLMPTIWFGSGYRTVVTHPRIANYSENLGPGDQWHNTHLYDQLWINEGY
jgi:ABC-type transport system substrate-binding protein